MSQDFVKWSCIGNIYKVFYFLIWRILYISPCIRNILFIGITSNATDLTRFKNHKKQSLAGCEHEYS
jgi:hypothetical protein